MMTTDPRRERGTAQARERGEPSGASLRPKAPDAAWLGMFAGPGLLRSRAYQIDTPAVDVKLDQNENPWDLPAGLKRKVLDRLQAMEWNRYPSAFSDDLAARLAVRDGLAPETCLLAPGSNVLIAMTLGALTKGIQAGLGGRLVIARPSFPLYETYCLAEDIPYEPWTLTPDFEYDVATLPPLPAGSIVAFASPNNPTGNLLPKAVLADLLTRHPGTMFLADEAYFEFAPEPYTDLLADHANLLLIRTFSKTMGAAGARLGYLLGAPETIALLRRARLPFMLNHFTVALVEVLLTDPEAQAHVDRTRKNTIAERDRLFKAVAPAAGRNGFSVKNSAANFLLLRWPTGGQAQAVYRRLIDAGLLVRNVSGAPGLEGCLRVSVGTEEENNRLIAALASIPA